MLVTTPSAVDYATAGLIREPTVRVI